MAPPPGQSCSDVMGWQHALRSQTARVCVYAAALCGAHTMPGKSKFAAAVKRAGVKGLNKPKATPSHKTKSHVVVVNCKGRPKTIHFGQHGVRGAGKHPHTQSERNRKRSFRARHAANIAKGPCSAAYWANKVKW